MPQLASFHLIRYPRSTAPEGLSRMGLDRPALHRTDGLRFWRLLGTGRGATMTMSADLRRWALFAVWEDESALDAFLATSPVAARWEELARERWHVRLEVLRSKGAWGGSDPLAGRARSRRRGARRRRAGASPRRLRSVRGAPEVGAVARRRRGGLARARRATAPSRSSRARRSAPPASCASTARSSRRPRGSARAPACSHRSASASGRSPARRRSRSGARSPTRAPTRTRRPQHSEVVRRTRDEDWYSEELFARFRPYGSTGTWNGTDPLQP